MDGDDAPRSANQGRTEPIPPSPGHGERASSDDASTGAPPDDPFAAPPHPPVLDAADGRPAIAVPGKPDGEVDTRT